MGTPQQRSLPRTIASDRVDDAAPSVAQHERTLAQSAAHLVALAHGRRAASPAIGGAGRGFDGISGSDAAEPRPDPRGAAGAARSKCVSSTRPHESSRAPAGPGLLEGRV